METVNYWPWIKLGVNSLLSLGLIGVTVALAYYTKRLVDLNSKPFIKLDLKTAETGKLEGTKLFLNIVNTGNGPAHNLEASWYMEGNGEEENSWSRPQKVSRLYLPPDQAIEAPLPLKNLESESPDSVPSPRTWKQLQEALIESSGVLIFEARCQGLFGEHTFRERVNVWEEFEGHLRQEKNIETLFEVKEANHINHE